MLEVLLLTGNTVSPLPTNPFGLFASGASAAAAVTRVSDTYVFSTGAVATGNLLINGADRAGYGNNTTQGLFAGGKIISPTTYLSRGEKLSFATGAWSVSTELATARSELIGGGNATRLILQGGNNGNRINAADKYTYADETMVPGTLLSTARAGMFGTANSTIALFSQGGVLGAGNVTTVDLYTFATDAVSVGSTALGGARSFGAAVSNPTTAYSAFGSGTAVMDKYTYANNTHATGTSMVTGRSNVGACGNSAMGIWAGSSSYTATTRTYTYAGDVVADGSNLTLGRLQPAGFSSTPGGFS